MIPALIAVAGIALPRDRARPGDARADGHRLVCRRDVHVELRRSHVHFELHREDWEGPT